MAKQTKTPRSIQSKWTELKSEYARSLNSDDHDHIEWALKQMRGELRLLMSWNKNTQNHLENRYRTYLQRFSSYRDYLAIKTRGKLLGAIVGECFRESDHYRLIEELNNSNYQFFRDSGDWHSFFDNVLGVETRDCDDCNSIELRDDIRWAYDGDRGICESCCDRFYHWSEYRETYVHDDDEDDDNEENGVVGEYHSSSENLDHIPSSHDRHKNPVYLGLELEMETSEGSDRLSKAEQLLNAIGIYNDGTNSYQYCLLENDGSLNDGFEMVTGWTGLDVHAKQLEYFKQPFRGMRSHDTRTCGLHIHICKRGMSMSHASKLILFINESSNQRLIKAIARRENPDYAKIKNKRADYRWLKNAKQSSGIRAQLMQLNEDRYEALNFKNPNTVEFRMFKGTLKYSTIMACLEFTYASWHFARDAGINNLTTEDFLKHISQPAQLKTTKNLRVYLQEKGFKVPTPVKQNPRIDQPETTTVEI